MKYFQELKNYDEFVQFVKNGNNYIYYDILNYTKEEEEKWLKFLFKNYIFYIFKNEYLIEFDKCRIESRMFYDDETPGPDINFENFKNYNLFYHFISEYSEKEEFVKKQENLKKYGCCFGGMEENFYLALYKKNLQAKFSAWNFSDKYNKFSDEWQKVEITQEEQIEYFQVLEDLKEKYIKRLENYYKKYSNKICAVGYWVNR